MNLVDVVFEYVAELAGMTPEELEAHIDPMTDREIQEFLDKLENVNEEE